MSSYPIHSRGPVRAETLLVGAWADGILPGQPRRFVTEETEVLWLRRDSTKYALYWDGKLLKEEFTHTDYYGPLTSFDASEAHKIADALALGHTDRLEVRATCRVTETPVRRTREEEDSLRPEYMTLDGRLYAGTAEELARVPKFQYLDDWAEGDWHPCDLSLNERLLAEAVVWSSRNTAEENAALWEAFRAPFSEGQP